MTLQITFHGAAQTVTGSCYLVTHGDRRILVDCGMFQGSDELYNENSEPFEFDPASVDVLLLTHAHLDHCGRIPLLVKRGFRGEIICTAATRELARVILLDSAHLHEEEAKRRRRHAHKAEKHGPLYDTIDALDSLERFGRSAEYNQSVDLGGGLTASFHDAGHILGSASVLLAAEDGGTRRTVLFSGDIGPSERQFLNAPSPPRGVDYVVMESTYGDRDHRSLAASTAEFYEVVHDADARGGNVIIPTFALERAQELLFMLSQGQKTGDIPPSVRVFLDSPMAISATKIFGRHPDALKPSVASMLRNGRDPFDLSDLHFTRDASESMALNNIRSGAIILAGSGMCTGGRIRHHLRHNLAHADCSIVFVGYAAEGTLARIIIDGARSVKLFGDHVPVKAHIHTINGFSAHAGRSDLKKWLESTGTPRGVFLVHGDADRGMSAMQKSLKAKNFNASCPKLHETVTLA